MGYKRIAAQSGVALLTILLLVVAITIVAGSMLASQRVLLRQYQLIQDQGNFREFALTGEAITQQLIAGDEQNNQTDSLHDSWAKPIPQYPVTGGHVEIAIYDDGGRFNINNLYHDGAVDTRALGFFQALLTVYGIDPAVAMAVLDWQDPDNNLSGEGGAEADFYQSTGKPLPMPIANQPFLSVDELQHVRGMDATALRQIRPLLTAVPYYLPMNVNTIKPELLAILPNFTHAMLNANIQPPNQPNQTNASTPLATATAPLNIAPLNLAGIKQWASTRATAIPIDQLEKFWAVPVFAQLSPDKQQLINPLLDVKSRAFRALITVKVDDKQLYLSTQLAKVPANPENITNNPPDQRLRTVAYNRRFTPIPIRSEQ